MVLLEEGTFLSIGNEGHPKEVVDALTAAEKNDPKNSILCKLSIHGVEIDQSIIVATIRLLKQRRSVPGKNHPLLWEQLEFINCRGDLETLWTMSLSLDLVRHFSLVRNVDAEHSGCASMGSILRYSKNLASLRLTTSIEVKDAESLADGLSSNTTLERLDFHWSSFSAESSLELARGLRLNKTLTEVEFFGCGLEDSQLADICAAVRYHPRLQKLILNNNKAGSQCTLPLCTMLESNSCRVEELSLGFQAYDSESQFDISQLAAALSKNTSLQSLDLSNLRLQDRDAVALAHMLTQNSTLTELKIARNKIGDEGISLFAERLPMMKGLKRLSLWGNPFSEAAAKQLLAGLRCNTELESLDLFRQFKCSEQLIYYTYVNRGGRKILHGEPDKVPLSLWALVLARANKMVFTRRASEESAARLDVLYCLLRGPVLFARGDGYQAET